MHILRNVEICMFWHFDLPFTKVLKVEVETPHLRLSSDAVIPYFSRISLKVMVSPICRSGYYPATEYMIWKSFSRM